MSYIPSYIKLHESGELKKRAETALEGLKECRMCPRNCGVNRLAGEKGKCRTADRALVAAVPLGLRVPLVYNSGGYDSLKSLQLLDGVIDIYMPDMKYADQRTARELSGIEEYPAVNQAAVREMHRQVGDLAIDRDGAAQRGLLVRHLVPPDRLAGTDEIMGFLSRDVSKDTYINIMDQYRPCFNAFSSPSLARPLLREEYRQALVIAKKYGLKRGLQGE